MNKAVNNFHFHFTDPTVLRKGHVHVVDPRHRPKVSLPHMYKYVFAQFFGNLFNIFNFMQCQLNHIRLKRIVLQLQTKLRIFRKMKIVYKRSVITVITGIRHAVSHQNGIESDQNVRIADQIHDTVGIREIDRPETGRVLLVEISETIETG